MAIKKMDHNTDDFINEYVKSLREGNAAIFAGAGLSVSSGYFDWKKLLTPVAKKLQLDIDEEHDLSALAQYFVDNKGGVRSQLTKILTTEFNKTGITLSENHEVLARLPISVYWTTNYDNLIETALKKNGKLPDIKINHAHLSVNVPRRDAIVYKMHGDVSDLANTVLTKHEYEDYNLNRELFSIAFKSDFVSRTMLFIGFSFTDPNLDYLISRIRSIQQHNAKTDYYFIKKEKGKKAYHRQLVRSRSLERYGLFAVWLNDYSDITVILKEIERRYLRSSVFISGSAADYGTFPNPELFIQKLSSELAKNGYKIVSGFGTGVGTYVVNGVLECMQAENTNRIDTYVKFHPFPLIHENSKEAEEIKKKYRHAILKEAGVAIFLFGNKKEGSSIVEAKGVYQEYKIAMEHGLKVIPISCTGGVAAKIFNELMSNFSSYYPDYPKLRKNFIKLGSSKVNHESIITNLIEILTVINKF